MSLPRPQRSERPTPTFAVDVDTCPLALQWIFIVLLDLGGHRQLVQQHGFTCDDLARVLGLEAMIEVDDFDRREAMRQLRQARRRFQQTHPRAGYPDHLQDNLTLLAELVGLDPVEQALFGFAIMLHADPLLSEACETLGNLSYNRLQHVLARLLELPATQLQSRLSPQGRLARCGLMEVALHNGAFTALPHRLSIDSQELIGRLRYARSNAEELFRHAFRPAAPATLGLDAFGHLGRPLEIARRYLKKALSEQRAGVNILLYGPPGTGKTQLSRALASALGVPLHEVACTDDTGDPITPARRMAALRSAMGVLQGQPSLVALDEIEDLFEGSSGPFARSSKGQKSWINRMLEENPVPCFWLSNSLEALDNAYIRRFDLVLEMPNPPRAQRSRIIREAGESRLGEALVKRLAAHEALTPAVVSRALDIGRRLHPRSGQALDASVECLVEATLKAQGFARLGGAGQDTLPAFYSPALLNTDVGLDDLLQGLRAVPEARLCFYGPPGTGKSAFGHWLARELERPLLIQRVSDLVSPYVGETESNMAKAFARASADGAVLLFDEVDSFLQDRRKARQRWEITAVNEMLTQMEQFRGLFIASTNLMQDLDEASLRRFDLKVHFDYLRPHQVQALLAAHLEQWQLPDPEQHAARLLQGQARLTPGTFATVARRARFKPFACATAVAEALLAECRMASPPTRPIGFVHGT